MIEPERIEKILVACDFSPASERALAWATHLQHRLGDPEVEAIHVWSALPSLAVVPVPPVTPSDADLRRLEDELRTVFRRHGLTAGITVEVATDAGAAIVRRATELAADLVVMGSHGRGGVARAVLGSVADWVVRKAPCPVVVLRAR
jgi:nucleotide-binding universal stress UspA family protein